MEALPTMIVANGSGLRRSVVALSANGSVLSVSGIVRTPTAHLLLRQHLDHQRATIGVPRVSHQARISVPKRSVSEVARISVCQVAWVVWIDRR
jgi:hypothetical protein